MAKKKPVKNMEQLEKAMEVQDADTDVAIVEEADDFQMSEKALASLASRLRDNNKFIHQNMLENVDRQIDEVVAKLRRYEAATDELYDVEDSMNIMEIFVSRHRYTMPNAQSSYVDRDVKLHLLAEVNVLVESGQFPLGADGKARTLTPMQQAALWY